VYQRLYFNNPKKEQDVDVQPQLVQTMWSALGEPLEGDAIVVSARMNFTVQEVTAVARTSNDLVTMVGTIEWNSGTPVITSTTFARVPLGTVAYMADEWRDEVGA
jgi:hypothetical protein